MVNPLSSSPLPPVLSESELIFPSQWALGTKATLSHTLHALHNSSLSLTNRLQSISLDAAFVSSVAKAYGLPLIANERCGSWYMSPEKRRASAYWKSSDGHFGEWRFSLRRLNLGVLDVVAESGGCIVVDSTRRGKSKNSQLPNYGYVGHCSGD